LTAFWGMPTVCMSDEMSWNGIRICGRWKMTKCLSLLWKSMVLNYRKGLCDECVEIIEKDLQEEAGIINE